MAMELNKVEGIDRNMDMQNKYVKEILDLIDECTEKDLLEGVSEVDIHQLRDHCEDIAMAANTAKKLAANLKPIAEAADKERKEKEKIEREAKKKAEAAEKRKAAAEKRKAKKAEEATEAAEAEAESADDDDLDFLG